MELTHEEIARLLSSVPILRDLDPAEMDPLVRSTSMGLEPRGSILFLEHDPGDVAYVVIDGVVDLVLESKDGQQVLLTRIGPGGHFGELALFDERPRSATAIVSEQARLLRLRREHIVTLVESSPLAARHVIQSFAGMVRLADQRIKTLSFFGVSLRLATLLLELDQPPDTGQPFTIRQEQLAAMTGSVRQTVSTVLSEWARAGLIETRRGRLTVLDRAALESLASM